MTPPIWVDLNDVGFTGPEKTRMLVRLNKLGTVRDLEKHHIQLTEGLYLNVYDHDADRQGNEDHLIAQGVVHYVQEMREWVVEINVADIRSLSEIAGDPSHWASTVDWAAIHGR